MRKNDSHRFLQTLADEDTLSGLQKGGEEMSRDIQDLLDLIKKLEERILALERAESVVHILPSDHYYWEHG